MSSELSQDSAYIHFEERGSTLRVRHAVVFCGQKLLYIVLTTLVRGDPRNITAILKRELVSKTKLKDSFTRDEVLVLESDHPKDWDITVLFKVIQKLCGLHLAGHECWNKAINGVKSLEYLLTSVKNWRNKMVHKFRIVINDVELKDSLERLNELAKKIITALKKCAEKQRKPFNNNEVATALKDISYMIDDVKVKTGNGGKVTVHDAYFPDDQESGSMEVTGAGQATQETSLQDVLKVLHDEFWKLAGPEKTSF